MTGIFTLRLSLPVGQGNGQFLDISLTEHPHDVLTARGFVPEPYGDEDDDRISIVNYTDAAGNNAEVTEWITEPEDFAPISLDALALPA